ncbi:prolyl oligopeptidase family serine peptidase [Polyangium sp. 15x6]|uniref:S9 family peptidase n=1 Tax=Polyangium sp. 15x6 TaxID=3042687 RepID=UPI00249A9A54|nr:prolyl oligopeptidase family serine peptidase [Polyangium sp. 15x6]MDI3291377.1 prolyl oligopeptidase family serine peptidase [Polyangium sp. 15x6]
MRARFSTFLALSLLGCGAASAPGPATPSDASTAPTSPSAAALPPWSAVPTPSTPAAPAPVAVTTLPAVAHPETRPLAVDVASLPRIQGVTISPDGQQIAYVVKETRLDADARPSDSDTSGGWKTEAQLWVVGRAGGVPRQLTRAEKPVGNPKWLPDSRGIAFVRSNGGGRKIHVLPVDGGEAEVLDVGELEFEDYELAPDGRSIAFTAAPPLSAAEKEAAWRSGGVIDEAARHRSSQLWVLERGKAPRRVTQGQENVLAFRWSPDGRRFVVITSPSAEPHDASMRHTARIISAADGAVVRDLTREPRPLGSVAWSPDGRHVAVHSGKNTLSLLNALDVYEAESGRSWDVADKLDATIGSFVWSGDSRTLTLVVAERTGTKLVRVPAAGGSPTQLGRTTRLLGPLGTTDRSGRFAATLSSAPTDPPAPTVVDLQTGALQVVAPQSSRIAGWTVAKTEVVRWKNADGAEIEGLLTVSPHAGAGPAPLLVTPHGGPDDVSQDGWNPFVQYMAARGYSVLRPNYRGSFGYGQAFYAANRGRLGEVELADIESGVDALIAAGRADAQRLYYGGWSWGGYVTAWTIGHTRRYRAAVVGAGVVDVVAQYAGSDINHGAAAQWEFRGDPWKQPEEFADSNPLRWLSKVVTPTLIAHGDEDSRVPPINGLLLYRALTDIGCEVRFHRYPREPHGFGEPAHQVHLWTNWAAWYAAH